MTSIIEKRRALHKNLANQQEQNDILKSRIGRLQALANIGTTTSMIVHEINNLLTPLTSYASLALKNPDDKSLAEKALQKTVQNCQRVSKIMESMLAVSNGEAQEKKDTPLVTLVEEIFTCLCRDFKKDGITVEIRIPGDLTVWAVPVQIQQVIMNLILNARDAMLPRGGILTIAAEKSGDTIEIEVTDTGCGIEPGNLRNIFEPFFTTKKMVRPAHYQMDENSPLQNSGAGIGLAFCKKIVDAHNGAIAVESEPGRGATFRITLPNSQ